MLFSAENTKVKDWKELKIDNAQLRTGLVTNTAINLVSNAFERLSGIVKSNNPQKTQDIEPVNDNENKQMYPYPVATKDLFFGPKDGSQWYPKIQKNLEG